MATHQSNLNSCIRSVWLIKQLQNATSGALAFIRWGIMLFILGMILDWQTFMPVPGRMVIFAVMVVATLVMAWRHGWKNLRAFNARNTVLSIEESLGRRDSLLVTAVQFGAADETNDMIELTCKRAEEEIRGVRSLNVVSFDLLKRPGMYLLALGLFMAALAGAGIAYMGTTASAGFLSVGVKRLFPPWVSTKYPTRTTIELKAHDIIVKEGDPVLIQADISGVIPDAGDIQVRPAIGKPFNRQVPTKDTMLSYEINSAYLSFDYRIVAGDDRSDWQTVTVIPAPRIQKAEVTLTYPDYTQRQPETVDALTLTAPEGTTIKWVLSLDRAVSESKMITATGAETALSVSDDGLRVEMDEVATSSMAYSFSWKEKSKGYTFKSPNNYLQVQPDEAPQVEITKPEKNIFATLGRKLGFSYRARDDHGIGSARIGYRINKLEEKTFEIAPPKSDQLGEVIIDWDYRETLKTLAIGDTVTFIIEMDDRYPGKDGPHRVRSQARRLSILSKNDYLSRMYRQKVRLLTQVKNIYREERGIHYLVKEFEPTSDNFIQTCQMEVVRQELIKERLLEIKEQVGELIEDLAANGFTEKLYTAELSFLESELQRIANDHIKAVSKELKTLSIASTADADNADITPAMDAVNLAARELGVMVLQLGFKEATEVMAREIHTISEDQAHLRWRTINAGNMKNTEHDDLTKRQGALADWLLRLMSSIPEDRESREDDALVAFKLSRLNKELTRASTAPTMRKAASSMGQGQAEKTADLQADVIKALLKAEFRLRRGLEHAALTKAIELFNDQAEAQKALREAIADMSSDEFKTRKADVKNVQTVLSKRLALLLMPAVPAPRYRMLDAVQRPKPKVAEYLAESVRAQTAISVAIDTSEREKTIAELTKAEETFNTLATLAKKRLEQLSESQRIAATAAAAGSQISKIATLTERLSSMLEKTEDAEAYGTDAAFVVPLLNRLALDLTSFKKSIIKQTQRIQNSPESIAPIVAYIENCVLSLKGSASAITNKKLTDAIDQQVAVAETFEAMVLLLTKQSEDVGSLSTAMSMNQSISEPGPLMRDIQSEQYDMVTTAKAVKDDELPDLAMGQKNLIHAVNAVLSYLDPFAHHIETGSVMLFAKDDMDAAAIGLREKDREEALDAGGYVAETLQKIIDQIYALAPQYTYTMELVEFIHEGLSESISIQAMQKQLSAQCAIATGDVALTELTAQQVALLERSRKSITPLVVATGLTHLSKSNDFMESAVRLLKAGDAAGAAEQMTLAVTAQESGNAEMLKLNVLITTILAPPLVPLIPPEFSYMLDYTSLATNQKAIYRATNTASSKDMATLAAEQAKLSNQCQLFKKRYATLSQEYIAKQLASLRASYDKMRSKPTVPLAEKTAARHQQLTVFFEQSSAQLSSAQDLMMTASKALSGGSKKEAISAQNEAVDLLRIFYVNNILALIAEPPPPSPGDPAPSFDISTEDDFMLATPGAVSGAAIKGGRQEWQVLGRRDRAALNENFARELPLEYRGILKNYYERLAE